MPDLEISGEMLASGGRAALIPLEAAMLYPDDERMRRVVADVAQGVFDRQEERALLPQDMEKTVRLRFCQGLIAGMYLCRSLDCLRNNEKITYVPEDLARSALKNIERANVAPAVTREMIRKYWRSFRKVSHFWAIYNALAMEYGGQYPFPCSHSDLPHFLALAEDLRRRAEQCSPRGRGVPLLLPTETWKVSPDVRLPRIIP